MRQSSASNRSATGFSPIVGHVDPRWQSWLAARRIAPDEELLRYLALFDADADVTEEAPGQPLIGTRRGLVVEREGGLVLPTGFVARSPALVMPGMAAHLGGNAGERGRTTRPIIVRTSTSRLVATTFEPLRLGSVDLRAERAQPAISVVALVENDAPVAASPIFASGAMRPRVEPAAVRWSRKRKLQAAASLAALVVLSALGLARSSMVGGFGGAPAHDAVQAAVAASDVGQGSTSAPAPAGMTDRPRVAAGPSLVRELGDDAVADRTGSVAEPRVQRVATAAVGPAAPVEPGASSAVHEAMSATATAVPSGTDDTGKPGTTPTTARPDRKVERVALATTMPEPRASKPGTTRKARKTTVRSKPVKVALGDRPRSALLLPDALKPH